MPEWLEDFLAPFREPWKPVGWPSVAAAVAFPLLVFLGRQSTDGSWTPLLDGVNLAFHEVGHPLFGIFGNEVLTALGGSLFQVIIPLVVLGSFAYRRDTLGVAIAFQWAAENLLYVATYIADSRVQELPLVGGGEHDWAFILGEWGLLKQDLAIAGAVRTAGWVGMALALGWLLWRRQASTTED